MESLVGAGRWTPIGGGLQPGETVPEAIVREFHEEVGWDVTVGEMAVVTDDLFPSPAGGMEHSIAFFAWVHGGPTDGSLPARRPGEEHQELAWIPLSSLGAVTLLPHHLADDIPAAMRTGHIVFRSERRGAPARPPAPISAPAPAPTLSPAQSTPGCEVRFA